MGLILAKSTHSQLKTQMQFTQGGPDECLTSSSLYFWRVIEETIRKTRASLPLGRHGREGLLGSNPF